MGFMDVYDLQATISADTSAHDKAVDASTQKARDLAKEHENTEARIKTSSTSIASQLKSLGVSSEQWVKVVGSQTPAITSVLGNLESQAVKTSAAIGLATHSSASSMAAVNAEINKMRVGNLVADYDKFTNALHNNSINSRQAANDFLGLFSKVTSHTKASGEAEAATHKLAEAFRVLSSSSVVAEGAMSGISSRLRALGTDASEVGSLISGSISNPLELAALAAVGLTLASGAVVAGIYELASSAAESTNKLKSLHDETGLSTDELQALKKAAEITGVSFESITTAAGLLEKKLTDAAANGSSKLSEGLRKLNIDISSSDTAINQVIELFGQLPDSVLRSGLAMDVWGRGGKQMLAVIDEMKGNAHAYTEEMRRMGEIIGTDDVEAAREFTRQQVALGIQFEVLKDHVAHAAFPIVESWLKEISAWLIKNQGEIMAWGHAFIAMADAAAAELKLVAQAIYAIPNVWVTDLIIRKVWGSEEGTSTGTGTLTGSDLSKGGIGSSIRGPGANLMKLALPPEPTSAGTGGWTPGPSPEERLKALANLLAGSKDKKGHKGGGGDPAKEAIQMEQERLRETLAIFKSEEDAYSLELKKREISLEEFTSRSIALEISRSKATIDQLNKELADAQKIKKGPQRDLETLKIQDKINDEKRRSAKAITDEIQKLSDDQLNRDRINEESRLAVYETVGRQRQERVKALASLAVITEEESAKQIAAIDDELSRKKYMNLQGRLDLAGKDKTKQAEILAEMAKLEADYAAKHEANERIIIDARQKDLSNLRAYADEVRRMQNEITNTETATARRKIELQGSLGVTTPKETRVALAGVDLKAENEQFAQYRAAVLSKVMALKQEIINIEAQGGEEAAMRKLQIVDEYYAQLKAATEQHEQAITEIQTRERVRLEENLRSASEQIASILVNAETTLFKDGWKAAFGEVLKGFLDMILQMEMKILASQVLKWLNKLAGISSPDDSSDNSDSGGSSGGGLSGLLGGLIKGLFSGGHAAGGSYGPGQLFPVNELGPEAFFRNGSQDMMWTGRHSGTVVPNSALQKSGDTYHIAPVIYINVPNIQAAGSGATQRQVAQQYTRLIQQAHLAT